MSLLYSFYIDIFYYFLQSLIIFSCLLTKAYALNLPLHLFINKEKGHTMLFQIPILIKTYYFTNI